MLFSEWIVGVLCSGGVGYLGYALLDWLERRYPEVAAWDSVAKRAFAWATVIVAVAGLYAVAVGMLWIEQPATWRGWVESIGTYALIAITASQGAHALDKARQERATN